VVRWRGLPRFGLGLAGWCGCAGGISRFHRGGPGAAGFWLVRGVRARPAGEDGGGLPVTPGELWDRNPLPSLGAGT
jgi:hypothetical protein